MITIKTYTGDWGPLLDIYNQSRLASFSWQEIIPVTMTEFQQMIQGEDIYALYENQEIVGFLSFYKPDFFIHCLFLSPSAAGKGLGTTLLTYVLNAYPTQRIRLKCIKKNQQALSFYQKNQFSVIEEGVSEEDGPYVTMEYSPNQTNSFLHRFWQAVAEQQKEQLVQFFCKDAEIIWPNTNEQFTVDEYIIANCEYPGTWQANINSISPLEDGRLMSITEVFSTELSFFTLSLFTMSQGTILRLEEFWSENGDAPEWRKNKNIGKSIF